MEHVENWVRLLSTFGPFALIIFIAVVLEPRARGQMKDAAAGAFAVRSMIYAFTWVAVFVMCGLAVWVWIRLNVPREEVMVRGQLSGLEVFDQCRSPMKEFYIQRTDVKDTTELNWRLISDQPLVGKDVRLYIDRSTTTKEDYWVYSLPIRQAYYGGGNDVLLTYDRDTRQLAVRGNPGGTNLPVTFHTPQAMILNKRVLADSRASGSFYPALLGGALQVVYAQKTDPIEGIATRLEADDVLVRLAARTDLAHLGASAVPYIQEILSAKDSSYRLRVGVIAALNNMSGLPAEPLSFAANCGMIRAAFDEDPSLKAEADRYLSGHPGMPTPKACGINAEIPCLDVMDLKLEPGGVKRVPVDDVELYLYLSKVSKGFSGKDSALVYVIGGKAISWLRGPKLGQKAFTKGLAGLKQASDHILAGCGKTPLLHQKQVTAELFPASEGYARTRSAAIEHV